MLMKDNNHIIGVLSTCACLNIWWLIVLHVCLFICTDKYYLFQCFFLHVLVFRSLTYFDSDLDQNMTSSLLQEEVVKN